MKGLILNCRLRPQNVLRWLCFYEKTQLILWQLVLLNYQFGDLYAIGKVIRDNWSCGKCYSWITDSLTLKMYSTQAGESEQTKIAKNDGFELQKNMFRWGEPRVWLVPTAWVPLEEERCVV